MFLRGGTTAGPSPAGAGAAASATAAGTTATAAAAVTIPPVLGRLGRSVREVNRVFSGTTVSVGVLVGMSQWIWTDWGAMGSNE